MNILIICLFVKLLSSQSLGQILGQEVPINIGLLTRDPIRLGLVEKLIQVAVYPTNVTIYTSGKLLTGNAFQTIHEACSMYHNRTVGMVTRFNDCVRPEVVTSYAKLSQFPVLNTGMLSNCPKTIKNNYFRSISLVFKHLDNAVRTIIQKEKWTEMFLLYDHTISRLRIEDVILRLKDKVPGIGIFEIQLTMGNGNDDGEDVSNFRHTLKDLNLRRVFKKQHNYVLMASESVTRDVLIYADKEKLICRPPRHWIVVSQNFNVLKFSLARDSIGLCSNLVLIRGIVKNRHEDIMCRNPSSTNINTGDADAVISAIDEGLITSNNYSLSVLTSPELEVFDSINMIVQATSKASISDTDWNIEDVDCLEGVTKGRTNVVGRKLLHALSESNIQSVFGKRCDRSECAQFQDDLVFLDPEVLVTKQRVNGDVCWDKILFDEIRMGDVKVFQHQKRVVRVVTAVESPFIEIDDKKNTDDNTDKGYIKGYKGLCIDLLNAMKKDIGLANPEEAFDFEIVHETGGVYGSKLQNKSWTGLIKWVAEDMADMAVAGMVRNKDREEAVSFTVSFMQYGVGMITKKPKETLNVFAFIEPLDIPIWVAILISMIFVSLTIYILSRISPFSRYNMDDNEEGFDMFALSNSLWFVVSTFMMQGCDYTPNNLSGRIIGGFWWFFALIMTITYTANLAAYLTAPQTIMTIKSLEELSKQTKIPYGTVKGSSLETFFEDRAKEGHPIYKPMWEYMSLANPDPLVSKSEKGYERVSNGSYVFLWDFPVHQYQVKLDCQLFIIGQPFNLKEYAFAVQKNSPYQAELTASLLRLTESGELSKIRERWFEQKSVCGDDSSGSPGLALKNVAGVFYILIIGSALGLFTAVCEMMWSRYMVTVKETRRSVAPSSSHPVHTESSWGERVT